MNYLQKSIFLLLSFSFTSNTLCSNVTMYEQVIPELLKHVNIENPSDDEKNLIIACHLLHHHGIYYQGIPEETMQTLSNTHIISDILPHLQKPCTYFGRTALAQQCIQATKNFSSLQQKTDMLRFLENNPTIVDQIEQILQNIIVIEKCFLQIPCNTEQFSHRYYQNWLGGYLNESKTAHEVNAKVNLLRCTIPLIFGPVCNKFICYDIKQNPLLIAEIFLRFKENSIAQNMLDLTKATAQSAKDYYSSLILTIPRYIKNNTVYNISKQIFKHNPTFLLSENKAKFAAGTITVGAYSFGLYYLYLQYKATLASFAQTKQIFDDAYEQQKTLLLFGQFIRSAQNICELIEKHPTLQNSIPEYCQFKELFNIHSKQTSQDFKQLIATLLSSSFEGESSYFISAQGKIIATYHLFIRIYPELVPYFQAFGHIDAYLATFKLYQQNKQHPHAQFCIVDFMDQQKPLIQAQGFWHPLLCANKVITNDLTMGTTPSNANLVITGPNAGGKTTALTALMINIIMAQAFGIAPATSLTLTPFSKIHSHLDITTNLQKGESLFTAEVNRAKRLKKSLQSCNSEEKAFTIIDEIFTGTNQEIASNLAFKFAQQLGEIKHSMTIITTHIPEMTTLEEKTNCYENFKVADANIADNGFITYPFKLVKGKSTQNIAQHMLEQEDII